MSYNIPVNIFVKRACNSIINALSVSNQISYDGCLEKENFDIKIFDINNNLYTIVWNDYTIISNQSGIFSNKEFDISCVSEFLKEGLLAIIGK